MHKIIGLAIALAAGAHAGPIGFNFSGTVTSVTGPAEPGFGGLTVGSPVFGSFSYDSNAVNIGSSIDAGYAAITTYLQTGPLSQSTVNPAIEIFTPGVGGYYWDIGGRDGSNTFALILNFWDTIAPFVQADALLRPPPDLALLDVHVGQLIYFHAPEPNTTRLNFSIDSITAFGASSPRLDPCSQPATGVPEPSTAALLAVPSGILLLWPNQLLRSLVANK